MFMDAVHNTNRKGYTVLTLMVKDEFGRGCPVAYCISSTEDAATWKKFISAAFNAAGVDPKECCFMTESSVNLAALESLGSRYILCHFHMLQDWGRALRSPKYGVSGRQYKRIRSEALTKNPEVAACEITSSIRE